MKELITNDKFMGLSGCQLADNLGSMYGIRPKRVERFAAQSNGNNTGTNWGGYWIPDIPVINDSIWSSINEDLSDQFFWGVVNWSWWMRSTLTAGTYSFRAYWKQVDSLTSSGVGYDDLELGHWSSGTVQGAVWPTTKTKDPQFLPKDNHKAFIFGTICYLDIIVSGGNCGLDIFMNFDGFRLYFS